MLAALTVFGVLLCVTLIFTYSKVMVLVKGTDVTIMLNYAEGAFT